MTTDEARDRFRDYASPDGEAVEPSHVPCCEYEIRCARCGLVLSHACGEGLEQAARRLLTSLAFASGIDAAERRQLEIDADGLLRAAGVHPGTLREQLEAEWLEDFFGEMAP